MNYKIVIKNQPFCLESAAAVRYDLLVTKGEFYGKY